MKKNITLITLAIFALTNYAIAQKTKKENNRIILTNLSKLDDYRQVYPKCCHFYNSSEDYYQNKPVENIEWSPNSYFQTFGAEKIEVVKNEKKENIKISELGYDWMSDEYGMLMRLYNKKAYIVVVDGPLCYYIQFKNGRAVGQPDGTYNYYADQKFFTFYSYTLSGEINEAKEKVFLEYFDKYGLKDKYKSEKVKYDEDAITKKLVKYIKLANQKAAKK